MLTWLKTNKLIVFKGSVDFLKLNSEFLQPAVTPSLFPVTDKKRSMTAVSGDTADGEKPHLHHG